MEFQEIKYSFIIPHRNNPTLLDRCLESIPQRDDIQIIVVDDNSDEGMKPIESERAEIEYVYISKEESKGAGRARNRGLAKAKGQWLLFPDSDDYYNQGFLYILDQYKNSTFDIVYFNSEYRDGKSLELLSPLPFQRYFVEYDGSELLKDEIKFHHNVAWTKMISRNYVTKYNLYFEEVPNGNDILFSMMAGYFARNILVLKEQIYVYLMNENSISTAHIKPVSFYMCKITHRVKQNAFFSFIGHSEWKSSVLKISISYIKRKGIMLFCELLKSLYFIIYQKNEWIDLIKSKNS